MKTPNSTDDLQRVEEFQSSGPSQGRLAIRYNGLSIPVEVTLEREVPSHDSRRQYVMTNIPGMTVSKLELWPLQAKRTLMRHWASKLEIQRLQNLEADVLHDLFEFTQGWRDGIS